MFSPIFAPPVTTSMQFNHPYQDQMYQPIPMSSYIPTPPSSDRFVAGEAGEQQQERIVTGYEEEPQQPVSAAAPQPPTMPSSAFLPPPPQSERSEAAGSDRREDIIMPPTQPTPGKYKRIIRTWMFS